MIGRRPDSYRPTATAGRVSSAAFVAVLVALAAAGGLGRAAAPAWASPAAAPPAAQRLNLDAYPRGRASDLEERYREWLEREVYWIITDPERDVFLRLDSDAKRDRFITEFWVRRDPTPGTPRNEYFLSHYERLAHASRVFGRNTPLDGARSDQGRIWILLGEPKNRQVLDNTPIMYPVEIWFYGVDPGLGTAPFFYVVFFRERGMGEYEFYSPVADGPAALLNPAGEQYVRQLGGQQRQSFWRRDDRYADVRDAFREISPDLSRAAFSLIPSEGGGNPSLRSEMAMAEIFELPDRIMPESDWAVRILTDTVESAVRFEALALEGRAIGLIAPDGTSFVAYVVATDGQGLNWSEYDGDHFLTFGIASSLTQGNTVLDVVPSRVVEAQMDDDMARRGRAAPVYFVDRQPAVPGRLRLEVVMENNLTRRYARGEFEVDVPAPDPAELRLGQPILCLDLQRSREQYDPYAQQFPFQVGDARFMPTLQGPIATGAEFFVFNQVYVPVDHGEPIRISYQLIDESGAIVARKATALRPDLADRFGVINHYTRISLANVSEGKYQLRVQRAGVGGAEFLLPLSVVDDAEWPLLQAESSPPPSDPEVAKRLAGQHLVLEQFVAAEALLRDARERNPDDAEALRMLIRTLEAEDRSEDVRLMLEPLVTQRPNDADLLAKLGEVNARLQRHEDAVRYYERLRLVRGDEAGTLNALAAEYIALQQVVRAIELLRRSLEIDPDQSRVRALLELAETEGEAAAPGR